MKSERIFFMKGSTMLRAVDIHCDLVIRGKHPAPHQGEVNASVDW